MARLGVLAGLARTALLVLRHEAIGIDDSGAPLALADIAAERERLAEGQPALAGEIIPPELAVKAMRDSGYKNTAYALAELIDNSVQANASNVELICLEDYEQLNERARRRS